MLNQRRMSAVRLGRLFGFAIFVAYGWFFGLAVASWTLGSAVPRLLPEASIATRAAVGVACAAGIFVALAVNELTHAVVLRRSGVPIRAVTLFAIGGITDAECAPASPAAEARAAAAAPVANVALAGLLVLAVAVAGGPLPRALHDTDRLGVVGVVVAFFAFANALVAATSIVPAYPLAGGRLLRAALWAAMGSAERATRWVAVISQVIGATLLIGGVALAVLGAGRDGAMIGLWITLLGWFVASAAAQGYVAATRGRGATV
jgi:Zn-dependent protease